MGVKKCRVCEKPSPDVFSDGHHKRPQATGPGLSQVKVQLCSGCHTNLHRVANLLEHGQYAKAEDAIRIAYSIPTRRHRIMELAKEVVYWQQLKKTGRLDPVAGIITIKLPPRERAALSLLAGECVKNGRQMGAHAYAKMIVLDHIRKKLPTIKVRNEKTTSDQRKPLATYDIRDQ